MHSCIYEGQVRHRRFQPNRHEFKYRLFYAYIDLDEIDFVFAGKWLWSTKRPALAWLRRNDYIGSSDTTIKQAVCDKVKAETGIVPNGPIRMLTHLRYFGYVFNPVTFYYCFDKTDSHVEHIVAEITNTPWGERHAYVLTQKDNLGHHNHMQFQLNKEFHISPFMPMDMHYDWRFTFPSETLNVHMSNYQDDLKIFDATLSMERYPLTAWHCARALTLFPFMTVKVISGIYWQAFRLFLKRIPFYTHPDKARTESDSSTQEAK